MRVSVRDRCERVRGRTDPPLPEPGTVAPLSSQIQHLHFRYGPIAIAPGQNLILVGPATIEKPSYDGYVVGFRPNLVRADGSVPPIEQIHLHHAVWVNLSRHDATAPGLPERIAASGEEKTAFVAPAGCGYPVKSSDVWALALDASTGRRLWSHDLKEPINGSAAIADGRVFVPLAKPGAPMIAALRLRDGRLLWRARVDFQRDADLYGSPVVWHGRVYIGVSALYGETSDPNVSVRGVVVALSERNGRRRWKTYTVPPHMDGGSVWSTPAIDTRTGRLYVGTGNAYHQPAAATTDSVLALDSRTGRLLAHHQATAGDVWTETGNIAAGPDADFGASPQLIRGTDGRTLLGDGQKSGTYWAFDRRTLKPAWNTTIGPRASFTGGIVGSTAYDGTRIYGPNTPAGEVWGIGAGGRLAWVSTDGGPLQFGAVSAANGVVYSNDMSGVLTAREASTGTVLARVPLGAPSWGGVAIAGGYVFAVTGIQGASGYVVAYRARG